MSKNKNKNYLDCSHKLDIKRNNIYRELSVYCKNCGHTMMIVDVDRVICTHCGYWVYKDDKIEFMYKMKETMKKEK
jgi:ribosomal protein S27AE